MERAIPILPINDPDEAKRFYVDGLGSSVVFEVRYAEEPTAGTTIGVERGSIRIHLDCPMPGLGRDACVYLDVQDADALYDEWNAKAEIGSPPGNQPWDARTFNVMSPFGNSLFAVGPIAG